ncbi:hypothetical protein chiPu_0024222, partial [Chiloscyllium punctatum]|nr:hypothetical protein [Chiloscyllium punctatum]
FVQISCFVLSDISHLVVGTLNGPAAASIIKFCRVSAGFIELDKN